MEQRFLEHQPYLPGLLPELPIKDLPPDLSDGELAEELADRLARETNQSLPVDIEEIAQFCGVVKTTEVPKLNAQGFLRLINETDYYHLELRAEDDPLEKRVTQAHELGHLALRALGREWTSKGWDNHTPVEEFCNRFARALLAPRSLLEPEVKVLNQANQEKLWLDHSDWSGSSKALTNELWQLLQITELPSPYLAQRLAADLELSENTLLSITMGSKREKRSKYARNPSDPDSIYWRNTPFQLWHPRLQPDGEDVSDLASAINKHFADELYNRWLKGLEARQKSFVSERKIYLGVRQQNHWLDIFETNIKGIVVCQDEMTAYLLGVLKPDKVASTQASSESEFPYKYFHQHIVKLLPEYKSDWHYVFV